MKNLLEIIKVDSRVNKSNPEVVLFLACFRFSSYLKKKVNEHKYGLAYLPFYIVLRLVYKVLSTIYLMELPVGTRIGEGLTIHHLKGTVINSDAILGKYVTINHFVTIADNITISDHVVINPLSVIVRGNIGKNAVVGAGSVVTKDVANNTIVAGSPAKPIGVVE